MPPPKEATSTPAPDPQWFVTTHWSTVLAATKPGSPQASQALETLCQAYWPPLYAFVRNQGHKPEDAADSVQEFFYQLLEKNRLALVDPSRGRFRSFLLTCLRTFLVSDWRRTTTIKRGGQVHFIPLDSSMAEALCHRELNALEHPEQAYERCWALVVLERVRALLAQEYRARGNADRFTILEPFLLGERQSSFAEAAAQLGCKEGSLRSEVHRLKKRFRFLLRMEVANTVAGPEQIDEELSSLIAALRPRPPT